jgi:large subunit ribosomal protein L29
MAHELSALKQFLRDASDDELERRLSEFKQEHFTLRVQSAVGGIDNPKRIRWVRKAIARLQTDQGRRRRERTAE